MADAEDIQTRLSVLVVVMAFPLILITLSINLSNVTPYTRKAITIESRLVQERIEDYCEVDTQFQNKQIKKQPYR
jgi:hypothetical protein